MLHRHESYDSYGYSHARPASPMYPSSSGQRMHHGYPPVNVPPVKPYPPDPYIDQFTLPEALKAGTLFRWLYDPYV
ncbi:MAG: spore coat associated protein CotJA, partial [Clostridia bacterium]